MMQDLNIAKTMLHSGAYTCVVVRDDTTYKSRHRGVKPLVAWYAAGVDMHGAVAADKVVGRATAHLYVLLGVTHVYAGVISRGAFEVLKAHGIAAEYDVFAEYIVNRTGDGVCPFESAVAGIDDSHVAYTAIRAKMEEMHISLDD